MILRGNGIVIMASMFVSGSEGINIATDVFVHQVIMVTYVNTKMNESV
jgi:hypothetical protein